jgi:radical SAM protein with 4Fe4S-binding SPASM domain
MILCYLKPTNFCSVGCEHCYLPESVRAEKLVMSDATLIDAANTLKEMAKRQGRGSADILIVWHGGEPLMLPPDFYFKAGEILDEIIPGHMETIQTSMIPYNKKYDNLVRNRFAGQIGTSIDFSQRKIQSSSERYLDVLMKRIEHARNQGFIVIPGMVPTKAELGNAKYIVDWFSANGFAEINIDRYNSYKGDINEFVNRPSNKEHASFLVAIYEEMASLYFSGKPFPVFNQIVDGVNGVLRGNPGDRWGGSCQRDFLVVEPDGETNNCPDKSTREPSFGNVSVSVDDVLKSSRRKKAIKHQTFEHMNAFCPTCEFNSWCGSGCPITPNAIESEGDCSGYKSFLLHIKEKAIDSKHKAFMLHLLSGSETSGANL